MTRHRDASIWRAVSATLSAMGGTAAGAVCGVIPGIVARKTFLAPQPDAGLGDLGPALLAFAIGAAGAVVGALFGFHVTMRALRRRGRVVNVPVSVLFIAVLTVPAVVILRVVLGWLAAAFILVVVIVGVVRTSRRSVQHRGQDVDR